MALNEFRICGDVIHLLSFLLLIRKIYINQSCAGVSGKSQLLIATVFTFRYLDLLTYFISIYNTLFKITYLGLAYFMVYLIFFKFSKTYDSKNDSFWNILIISFVCVLTLYVNYIRLKLGYDVYEIYRQYLSNPLELTWTFSIYLEAIAIIPQFYMLQKTRDGQNILHYIFALAVYRGLYICNWIYRYFEYNYVDFISSISGTVQTFILVIVLIYILVCKRNNPKWQEIAHVFTIEATKLGNSKQFQPRSFSINQSQKEDLNNLLP